MTEFLRMTAQNKNPVSSKLNRVALALAVFIKRPQAEVTQIGAELELTPGPRWCQRRRSFGPRA
jgi:hypothetical protein